MEIIMLKKFFHKNFVTFEFSQYLLFFIQTFWSLYSKITLNDCKRAIYDTIKCSISVGNNFKTLAPFFFKQNMQNLVFTVFLLIVCSYFCRALLFPHLKTSVINNEQKVSLILVFNLKIMVNLYVKLIKWPYQNSVLRLINFGFSTFSNNWNFYCQIQLAFSWCLNAVL